jgi:hypothetical protein
MDNKFAKLLNTNASDVARRALEKAQAFANDDSVKITEAIRYNGFTYGRVEPIPRDPK